VNFSGMTDHSVSGSSTVDGGLESTLDSFPSDPSCLPIFVSGIVQEHMDEEAGPEDDDIITQIENPNDPDRLQLENLFLRQQLEEEREQFQKREDAL
jgi:hypothetical protein